MNKSIERRLNRLAERLLPDRPGRCWQIIIWSPEGPVKGVRSMAATGFTHEQIASCLGTSGIDPKTMRKHFRVELATAANKANAAVANKLYQMAVAGHPPAATFFWMKTRCGYRETTRVEHSGPGGVPLMPIESARALLESAAASRPPEDPDEDPIKK